MVIILSSKPTTGKTNTISWFSERWDNSTVTMLIALVNYSVVWFSPLWTICVDVMHLCLWDATTERYTTDERERERKQMKTEHSLILFCSSLFWEWRETEEWRKWMEKYPRIYFYKRIYNTNGCKGKEKQEKINNSKMSRLFSSCLLLKLVKMKKRGKKFI